MSTMAKSRKRAGGKSPPKKILVSLKTSEEFGAWFDELLAYVRLPAPVALEHALIEFARVKGFDKPAPER